MRGSRILLASVLGSLACGGGGTRAVPSTENLHADCSNQPCAAGQTCLSYYGILGPPLLIKSCEIQCSANAPCPPPTVCTETADGPPGTTCW